MQKHFHVKLGLHPASYDYLFLFLLIILLSHEVQPQVSSTPVCK